MEIYRQVGARLGEANTLDSLALANYAEGNYQNALKFHQQALDIFTLIESRYDIAWSLRYLGKANLQLNNSWQAKELFEKAGKLFEILEMHDSANACQQEIQNITNNSISQQSPTIGDDRTPQQKKPFPLWQTVAALLLILGIGYWQTTAPQRTKPIGIENVK
jgi:tetratricopeptide (TPR) repeat protein